MAPLQVQGPKTEGFNESSESQTHSRKPKRGGVYVGRGPIREEGLHVGTVQHDHWPIPNWLTSAAEPTTHEQVDTNDDDDSNDDDKVLTRTTAYKGAMDTSTTATALETSTRDGYVRCWHVEHISDLCR